MCKSEIIETLKGEIEKLSHSLDDLKERVKGIEDNLVKTNEKLAKHDDDFEALKSDVTYLGCNIHKQVFTELDQRNNKVNNVIISGLEEVEGSVSEKQNHDLSEAQNIISEIVDEFEEDDIRSVIVLVDRCKEREGCFE